jgi:hypothetical protein
MSHPQIIVPFARVRMAPLVAFLDLKALLETFVVGRWLVTAPGIFASPPALNLNGSEARSTDQLGKKMEFQVS